MRMWRRLVPTRLRPALATAGLTAAAWLLLHWAFAARELSWFKPSVRTLPSMASVPTGARSVVVWVLAVPSVRFPWAFQGHHCPFAIEPHVREEKFSVTLGIPEDVFNMMLRIVPRSSDLTATDRPHLMSILSDEVNAWPHEAGHEAVVAVQQGPQPPDQLRIGSVVVGDLQAGPWWFHPCRWLVRQRFLAEFSALRAHSFELATNERTAACAPALSPAEWFHRKARGARPLALGALHSPCEDRVPARAEPVARPVSTPFRWRILRALQDVLARVDVYDHANLLSCCLLRSSHNS